MTHIGYQNNMETIYIEVNVKLYKPIKEITIDFTINLTEDDSENYN